MKLSVKQILLIIILIVSSFAFFVFSVIRGNKEGAKDDAARTAIIKNIQFKGKVINYKIFYFGGRKCYMVCLKLDYSNTKSFYVLNNLCFLKIKNGIATMAVGFLDPYYGIPKYVEINMNNNDMEHYIYPSGETNTFGLSLSNYDLTSADINTCN